MKKHILFITLGLFLFVNYLASQTRIQTATGNTGTSTNTTFAVTLASTPVNGNTLIAVISTRSNTTDNVTSITQNGATWTRAISSTGNSTNNTTTEIWYTTALSGAATAITITQGSARSAAVIMEYSGLVYGSPLDQTKSNYNTSTSTAASTGTTGTTVTNDELWIGGFGLRSSGYSISSITNSFTSIASSNSTNSTSTNNAKIYALERTVSTTGTAFTEGTVSAKSYWSGAVATFKVAVINSFSPISACKGSSQIVTLNGEGFTSGSVVSFNGTTAVTNFVSSTQLTATLPAAATPGFITVNTAGNIITSKKPFLIKAPVAPTANITNATCPSSSDGAVVPTNIPVAVNFDNTKSQYLNLGTTLLNSLNAFTIEGWVKCTTFNRNSFFGQNNAIEIGLTSSGTVELWSEGLNAFVYSPAAFPTDGLWHHIAGTGDGTNMKIYIDGALIARQAHAALPTTILYGSSAFNAAIGGYVWDATSPNYHTGQFLKVGFWNTALTNTQIADLASTPHQYFTGETNLIAGYNFFEGNGTSLSKTPSGTNGTFQGTPVSIWTDLFTYSWTKSTGGFSSSTKNISELPTGTYNLAATFNGCIANSGNFVVASNGTESSIATASVSGASPICSGGSSTLTLSGGSLGTAAAWKWYSASCGGTPAGEGISITVNPTATTTYYVRAEGTCNTTACLSFTVTVNAIGQWLGITSDWNDLQNWCTEIPTSATNVVIPAGVPYQPTIGDANALCNSLTINNGATVTISGTNTLTVHGNLINNGTFTANNSTVIFNGTSTISGATSTTFNNLTINSEKSLTAASGTMNVTGNWTNNGTFTDNSGTIIFNGTTAQDITGVTIFNNLTVNNVAGVVGKSNLTVNGVLNLASENPSATLSALDMNTVYSTDVLTSSNILSMGSNATTTGIGDATGRIVRTTIVANVDYSFGNANTTIRFYGSPDLPTELKFIPRIGVRHAVKNNNVKRTYQIVRTGGNTPTQFTLKLAYLQSELDTITESRLIYWDHHIAYSGVSPHEHGKTELNTTNNWITLAGHGIRYIASNEYSGEVAYVNDVTTPQSLSKIWMISGKQSTSDFIWLGAANTDWDVLSNWSSGKIPTASDNVIIPNSAARNAEIPMNETRVVKSITIESNRTLTLGNGSTLEVYGSLADNNGTASWNNLGNFTANTGTVAFKRNNASISGTTQFYKISNMADSTLILLNGSSTSVSGEFTNNGVINGSYNGSSTFVYNGGDQTVQTNSNSKYHHLILSGTGTKTIQSANLTIKGDLTLNTTITAQSSTVVFDGTTAQTLTGSSDYALNNVTLNNSNGLTLSKNQKVDGVLTFTNGLITTADNNVLNLGCVASTLGESNSKYVNGKLAREYCTDVAKLFPIGKGGQYRPLTITRTDGGVTSTAMQAEQFELAIPGVQASNTNAFTSRFWSISQTVGAKSYTIQLDGTGFTPAGTAVILKGNGNSGSPLNSLVATTPNYTTSSKLSTFGDFTLGSECVSPTINTQPSATSTCESSGTALFAVSVAGTVSYQWEVNTGSGWTTVSNTGVYSNATTATLTITNPPFSMNGYAYRAIVTRTDCVGTTTSNSAVLTVNPQPQGSLSANSICKGEEGFLTWTATAGTGPFTVVYSDGTNHTQSGVTSGTHFSVGAHTASKTYTLVSVTDAATSCTRISGFTQNSATVTVNPYITWVGGSGDNDASKRDWQIATNWCGGVPTTTDNVLIPAAPTYQPVISSTGTGYVHSIIVENGASVSVDGAYVFNVSGNITNAGTISMGIGTLTIDANTIVENVGVIETQNASAQPLPPSSNYGTSGTIRFNGDASQTLFAGNYYDVIIDNPQGVVLSAGASVVANGTLEIKSGSKLEIGTGRMINAATVINNAGVAGIIIKSAADAPTGTLIFNNNENTAVQATVEMYTKSSWDLNQLVNSKYKWQFFGIPIQSMPALPTFYGGYVRQYNESGIGAGSLATNRWIQLNDQSTMEALEGYELVMPSPRTFNFEGQLYNQDIVKTLSYTSGADYPGQHLIGNPYTAAIDIKQITFGANTQETVYLYNTGTFDSWKFYNDSTIFYPLSEDSASYIPGQYVAIPKNLAGSAKLPRQIPSMQAFMVRTTGTAEGSVTVSYNAVKQKNFSLQRAKQAPLSSLRINLIGEKMDNDVTWLFSQEGTTRKFDNGWDGLKMAGDAGTARIQSLEGDTTYQINTVPDIHETLITARAGANDTEYMLKITNENMSSKYPNIYLFDMLTKDLINITGAERKYAFTMTNRSSEPRFKILTSLQNVTDLELIQSDLFAVAVDKALIINNKTADNGHFTIYDVNGAALYNQIYPANQKLIVDLPLQAGVYICKLVSSNGKVVSSKLILK